MVLSSGELLGPYELLSPLGEGGMGEVWKARDTRLDRAVAIKIAKHGFDERFHREARAIASLNHPHICTLFDVGENFLVMEYVEGGPIRGPLAAAAALQYGAQIARALDAAHRIGIVHRDLKPGNILVTKAGVKLLDFGLAKVTPTPLAPGTETLTRALTEEGTIVGTIQYMAPEQLEGKEAGERSDIFALGCVMYEALTGTPAFNGASRAAVIAAILECEPKPLSGIPPAAASAITRCLAKDPEDRWQSARDVAAVFETAALQQAPAPQVEAAPVRKRSILPALLLAAIAALALGAVARYLLLRRQPAPEAFWSGQSLGGPAMALGPRVSPDGQTVAFQAIVDGQAQVAIMKPQTGNWTLLTRQKDAGRIADIEWARDGSKIYFDRDTDIPHGIYSVEALGGDPRLVLEDACVPVVLADGSLVVHRINSQRETQLYRYWPDSGQITALPAIAEDSFNVTARATHDGRQVVFYGYPLRSGGEGALGIYRLDPTTGAAVSLSNGQIFGRGSRGASLAATPDGKSLVYCVFGAGLNSVVSVPLDGSGAMRQLFTLTNDPWYLDVAPDGAIYADEVSLSNSVIRFPATGGAPEQLAGDQDRRAVLALALPDGRPLLYTVSGFRRRFQIVQPDGRLTPLIESGEQFGPSAALAGDGKVAVMSDLSPAEAVVVGIADGRVQQRVPLGAKRIGSLAASPDGETFYYTSEGYAWSVPASGGAPQKLTPADAVSADANGRDLIVSLQDRNAIRLMRVSVTGGDPRPIALPQGVRQPGTALPASIVGPEGSILLSVATPSEWFLRTGILTSNGDFHMIAVNFNGQTLSPLWSRDGRIIAMGANLGFGLWRFRQ